MPDLCRSFYCPFDAECRRAGGRVHPFGEGKAPNSWRCVRCNKPVEDKTRDVFMRAEEVLRAMAPLDRDLKALLAPNQIVFDDAHHLVFEALDKQVCALLLCEGVAGVGSSVFLSFPWRQTEVLCRKKQPALAEVLAARLAMCADRVLVPKFNPEKVRAVNVVMHFAAQRVPHLSCSLRRPRTTICCSKPVSRSRPKRRATKQRWWRCSCTLC
jgi:hypothetical protein